MTSEKIKVGIVGASGRMGQMLIKTVDAHAQAQVCGATERSNHNWIGQDLGLASGTLENGIVVSDDADALFAMSDAVLDFTIPVATVGFAKLAAKHGCVHVIGTTGFDDADLAAIAGHASSARIVRAGNMSLGVNLLTALTQKVAAALDTDFDIEVVEAHHRHKIDAPSGTALMLGEAAARGRGIALDAAKDSGRDGITGARKPGDIGFSAIRGGDIVGEHDVIFAGEGERIILRHVATDRALFAKGAVKAALWAQTQPNGEYSMFDVLGL